jgi:ketosteroid isomerase-like protein
VALDRICANDILWTQNPGFPGGVVSRGISSIIENVFEANSKRWKYFSFERSSISVAHNTVLVEGLYIVQGHDARERASAATAHVFKIEEGKVISFQQYTDSKTLWDNRSIN